MSKYGQLCTKLHYVLFSLIFSLIFGLHLAQAQNLRRLTPEEGKLLQELQEPRRIILAIGINQFEDPFWNSLRFAESDASQMFKLMRNEVALPFDSGELLTQSSQKSPITKQSLLQAFERLKAMNTSEEDTIVVYLSTHGTIFLRKNAKLDEPAAYVPYFVTADTDHKDIQQTAISRDELMSWFQSLKSQRKALIIATCHSGGGKAQITPDIREALKRLKGDTQGSISMPAGRGFSVLAASSWSEPAAEDDKLGHDVYTYHLLEAIREHKGVSLTLTQAHDLATRRTISFTKNMQNPTIQLDQAGGDPIVLKGDISSGGLAYVYSYISNLKNLELKIGGRSKGIIGEGQLTVPEGKQRIEIIDPKSQRTIATRVIRLSPGKEYSLVEIIQTRSRWHGSFGYGFGRFFNNDFYSTYAPAVAPVLNFGFRYDAAIGLFDLHLLTSLSNANDETVRFAGQPFDQRRSWYRTFLLTGGRETLSALSRPQSWRSEWGWAAGPGLLKFERKIQGDGKLAAEQPNASAVLPGLGATSFLEFQQFGTGLEFGLLTGIDLYYTQGRTQNVKSWTSLGQLMIYVGSEW